MRLLAAARGAASATPCRSCAQCCRTVRVPLTDADLRRLVAATNQPASDIVEWRAPEEIDMLGEPETLVRLREGRRFLLLAHESGACRFLDGGRCSVYPSRPATCAAFPFFVAPDGVSIKRLAGPCDSVAIPGIDALACLYGALTAELEAYAARVGAWNRRQRHRVRLHRPPESREHFMELLLAPASTTVRDAASGR